MELSTTRGRKVAKIIRTMAGRRCEGIQRNCRCFAECKCGPCGKCIVCDAKEIRRAK